MSSDEHIWFDDHAAAYALGGLSAAERGRMDAHATECAACAEKLAGISETDRNMNNLFASVRPGSGFEQAIIDRLERPMRLVGRVRSAGANVNPLVRRAAVAAAAAIVLGGFGYVANQVINDGEIMSRVRVASNLRQIGQAILLYSKDGRGAWSVNGESATTDALASPAEMAKGYVDTVTTASSAHAMQDANATNHRGAGQNMLYGGGTNTAQNWVNWDGTKDSANLAYHFVASGEGQKGTASDEFRLAGAQRPVYYAGTRIVDNSAAPQTGGQNVLTADGHPQAYQNAFSGIQRDNVMVAGSGDAAAKASVLAAPGDGNDSILLPTDDDEKGAKLKGVNTYTGGTVVAAGVLKLDTDKAAKAESQPPAARFNYFRPGDPAGGDTGALSKVGTGSLTLAEAEGESGAVANTGIAPTLAPAGGGGGAGWGGRGGDFGGLYRERGLALNGATVETVDGAVALDSNGDGAADAGMPGNRSPRAAGEPVAGLEVSGTGGLTNINSAPTSVLDQLALNKSAETDSPAPPTTPAAPTPAPTPAAPPPLATTQPSELKVIRNGTMEFVVDSFDSALLQVTAIVNEEGGYVGTTNSQKLPNGKVEGTITIRVKPQNLDVLVLKLRALGELKEQKISSEDVTKEYTDLGSELRAARAMEERLLDLIKDGKGAIKDLLAAEKELGEWRGKIEQITGQMNYYDNLVAMSTLEITLSEKDIKTPALASQSETVDMGVETEDVEKARTDAIAAIDEVKGRIVESELKQFDAGQMAGKIVADIAPEKAGPVIDHLKQLGTVSRLQVQRAEVTTDGHGNAVDADTLPPGLRMEEKDTRLTLSLYNLANVAPRQTVNVELACDDVDGSYHAILDRVAKAGGRVISSNLSRPTAEQVTGSMSFEIKSADADGVLMDVKAAGDVMVANTTENPDTNNVTSSKRGFSVQLRSMASVNPKQTVNVELACDDVDASYHAILDQVAKAGGRVVSSSLNRPTPDQVMGTMSFEVKSADAEGVLADVKAAGDVMQSNTAENQDQNNVTKNKRGFIVTLRQLASVNPREVRTVGIATGDVTAAYEKLLATVQGIKARIVVSKLDNEQDASGNQQNETAGWLDFEVKRDQIDAVEKALADAGDSVQRQVLRSNDAQNTLDTKVQFKVGLHNATLLPPRESWTLAVESGDVDGAQGDVLAAMGTAGGRVVDSTLSKEAGGKTTAHLVIDVPLDQAAVVVDRVKHEGDVRVVQSTKNAQAPEGKLAKARLDITIGSPEAIVSGDRGLWSTVRAGLTTSATVLLWSLQLVVTGVCLIAPFAAIIWGGWWVVKRRKAGLGKV